jgi:hypothetical protein
VDCTLAGLDLLLHRTGWSVQVPARQAAERDEARLPAPHTSSSAGPSSSSGIT